MAPTAREVKTAECLRLVVRLPPGTGFRPAKPAAPASTSAGTGLMLRSLSCVLRWGGRANTCLSCGEPIRWVTAIFLIRCAVSVLRIRCLLLLKGFVSAEGLSRQIVSLLYGA